MLERSTISFCEWPSSAADDRSCRDKNPKTLVEIIGESSRSISWLQWSIWRREWGN